jgi:hypothetical protein
MVEGANAEDLELHGMHATAGRKLTAGWVDTRQPLPPLLAAAARKLSHYLSLRPRPPPFPVYPSWVKAILMHSSIP